MDKLAQHDPLALTAIEFNIKSVQKYTSVATILLSVAIVVLSIVVNLSDIRHIWIPMEQLPRFYSLEKNSLSSLTEGTPLCLCHPKPIFSNSQLVVTQLEGDSLIESVRRPLEGFGSFSYMESYVNGKNFVCFDLKGISFNNAGEGVAFESPSITISEPYEIYLKQFPLDELFNPTEKTVMKRDWFPLAYKRSVLYADFVEITVFNKLSLNYEPTFIQGLVESQLSP